MVKGKIKCVSGLKQTESGCTEFKFTYRDANIPLEREGRFLVIGDHMILYDDIKAFWEES